MIYFSLKFLCIRERTSVGYVVTLRRVSVRLPYYCRSLTSDFRSLLRETRVFHVILIPFSFPVMPKWPGFACSDVGLRRGYLQQEAISFVSWYSGSIKYIFTFNAAQKHGRHANCVSACGVSCKWYTLLISYVKYYHYCIHFCTN